MNKAAYYKKVYPSAVCVETATGIPAELVTAWWSWETNFGTNRTSKVFNEAGITKGSKGKDFVSGNYAGYYSHENFVKDYIRIIFLPDEWRGYRKIIEVARRDPGDYASITQAHNASRWSEMDYNVKMIVERAEQVKAYFN